MAELAIVEDALNQALTATDFTVANALATTANDADVKAATIIQ